MNKMGSRHFFLNMHYGIDAHVKGELLVMIKTIQGVNLLILISNTLIEVFNKCFWKDCEGIPGACKSTHVLVFGLYPLVKWSYHTSTCINVVLPRDSKTDHVFNFLVIKGG